MNIKYKHGITDQGKEMLVTEDLEEGVRSPGASGWTLRRRGLYALALFSICVTMVITLTVAGNRETEILWKYLFEHFQPLICSRKKSA